MSKNSPSFESKTKESFGLKHMEDNPEKMPIKQGIVMEVTPIKPLTGISPMESAHCSKKPFKPKGRG